MKNPNDYNGWEQYVMSEVDNKPPAFMPQNTTVAMQRMEEADEEASNKQAEQIQTLINLVSEHKSESAKAMQTMRKELLGRIDGASTTV